eukprot:6863253-Prorocentrum_lima.AAC.1
MVKVLDEGDLFLSREPVVTMVHPPFLLQQKHELLTCVSTRLVIQNFVRIHEEAIKLQGCERGAKK